MEIVLYIDYLQQGIRPTFSSHNKTDQKVISTISHATLYNINANRTEMRGPQNLNSQYKKNLKGHRYAKIVQKKGHLISWAF